MYPNQFLYLQGEFIEKDARATQTIINPATGEVVGHLPMASPADLDRALAAAQKAFDSWRWTSPMERSAILRKVGVLLRERSEEIAQALTLDQGKPLAEARAEVASAADHADWHAEEGRRIYGRTVAPRRPNVRQTVMRQPVGVCAAFTPWNFPLIQATRKVAAAIGAGCTMILKGPETSPSAVGALARAFHDAGLPPGCFNVVWGVPHEVSEHLIRSPIVRKISFTGSVAVGKQLASLAGQHMKRMTLELGGHAPVIVFDDANIEWAATQLAAYKGRNAGQVCVSPSRFYVHDAIYAKFMDRFVAAYSALKVGDGMAADTTMGPLVNGRRVEAIQRFVDDARARGGRVVTGGAPLQREGSFFPPTVLADVPDDSMVMTEEPFGPLAALTRFGSREEVIARANSLPYGLASYVFTESLGNANFAATHMEAGMVNINHFGIALPETPFGGIKDSGVGQEGGQETFDCYLVTKFVSELTPPY